MPPKRQPRRNVRRIPPQMSTRVHQAECVIVLNGDQPNFTRAVRTSEVTNNSQFLYLFTYFREIQPLYFLARFRRDQAQDAVVRAHHFHNDGVSFSNQPASAFITVRDNTVIRHNYPQAMRRWHVTLGTIEGGVAYTIRGNNPGASFATVIFTLFFLAQ